MTLPTNYRQWYGTRRWQRIARMQLRVEPWCVMCAAEGKIGVPANVADHVVPHKGDQNLFWYGKLQSLCYHHHNSHKAQIERMGYVTTIGKDGWPIDPKHPANRGVVLHGKRS
jgi:5-methylcytosine-specific restriction enzyme A